MDNSDIELPQKRLTDAPIPLAGECLAAMVDTHISARAERDLQRYTGALVYLTCVFPQCRQFD